MIIRYAEEKDINQIIALCELHAAHERAAYSALNKADDLAKYLFGSKAVLKCLVVELNHEIIGYATFMKQFSTWNVSFYLYLDCLFLKEETRGKGIGAKLMHTIKDYAKSENCDGIEWQTPNFNTNAIAFYKKLGASSKSKERFFWS